MWIIIGRRYEISAEEEVRITGEGRFLVITMSRTYGLVKELYGLVVVVSC
jgi:hypothetical protein